MSSLSDKYEYVMVVGMLLAAFDAFGIGANDNANNFANAVAAKVVTPLQAVLIAAVFEFAGAVLVGNNVAEAIRGRIIQVNLFRSNPYTLQLGMVCALAGSSTWLMLATRLGVPVSTTHCIIGGVLGMGVAAFGPNAINWEYGSGRGFSGIVASWFISIAVSGVFAALLYGVMYWGILRYRNSFQRSLLFGPIVFGIAYGIMALSLVWKGTPKLKLDNIPDNQVVGIVLGVWAVSMVLTYFWVSIPLYRYHWLGQDLKWTDYILGGFAPNRPVREGFDTSHIAPLAGKSLFDSELDPAFAACEEEIKAYNERVAAAAKEEKEREKQLADDLAFRANQATHTFHAPPPSDSSDTPTSAASVDIDTAALVVAPAPGSGAGAAKTLGDDGKSTGITVATDPAAQLVAAEAEIHALRNALVRFEAEKNSPRKMYNRAWVADFKTASWLRRVYLLARYVACFGIDGREITDYYKSQADTGHLAFAPKWESKSENFYTSLNVITSMIQSFAHGSNDVANAIGPMSTIWFIYANGTIPGGSAPVDVWQLAYGAAFIVLGLALYGYNVMRVLGNNLTYQSPSRGFCMDVGSAVTILIASKEGFPISTTQCITGATVGVGVANGDWRAVNWRLFAKIFASWVITLPMAGLTAGCLYAFIAYAPKQDCAGALALRVVNATVGSVLLNGRNVTNTRLAYSCVF